MKPCVQLEEGVLGGDVPIASVPGEIVVRHRDGFYSYDAKYVDAWGAELRIPAELAPHQTAKAQALALQVFEVLECHGLQAP